MAARDIIFDESGRAIGDAAPLRRWRVLRTYRRNAGPVAKIDYVDEISDVADLIENGPHWDTLISCVIEIQNPSTGRHDLTLEQAEAL